MNDNIERLRLAAEDTAGGPPSAEQVDALVAYADALESDLGHATKALEAVLVLHRPWNRGRDVVCSHCKRNTSPMPEPEHWPCPTVKAITAALEGPSA